MAAFDSTFTAGVFHLEPGDKLSVESDNHGAFCSVITRHDHTFIGAVRLQMGGLPPHTAGHRRASDPTPQSD